MDSKIDTARCIYTLISNPYIVVFTISNPYIVVFTRQLANMISQSNYIILFLVLNTPYVGMMLFTPKKMVEDHFHVKATPMLVFWARCMSAVMIPLMWAIKNHPDEQSATELAAATAVLIAFLGPFNAKFGYLTPERLSPKYPASHLGEGICGALAVLGLLALFG